MKSVWRIVLFLEVLISLSLSQDIPDVNQKTVQNGLLNFGIKLNSILLENNRENKNILFSPFNIYNALALIHLGSNGTTRDTISNVLDIPITFSPKSLQEVLLNFSSVSQYIIVEFPNGTVEKENRLIFSNLMSVESKYVGNRPKLKKEYVEDVKLYHNSFINNIRFPIKWTTIDGWISNLEEPVPKGNLHVSTLTLYFKSVWQEKFNQELTKEETFRTDKGNITVEMMNSIIKAPYANIPSLGVEVVNLKFTDAASSMFVGMPRENQLLDNFLRNLTSDQIHTIVDRSNLYDDFDIDLKFPKTSFNWYKSVKNDLTKLGLKEEFWNSPDLSNIVIGQSGDNIEINDIDHGAIIRIKEDGINGILEAGASAVPFVTMDTKLSSVRPRTAFYLNRPFFLFIYNHDVNTIMYFGTVFDPSSTFTYS